jgi:hypothetical protein
VKFSDFLGCDGTDGSCYNNNADSNCCGCPNWSTSIGTLIASRLFFCQTVPSFNTCFLGTKYVPTGADATCGNTNSQWIKEIMPVITYLKEACPSCYSFPYDDPTSTFTCSSTDANGFNNFSYEGILFIIIKTSHNSLQLLLPQHINLTFL